MLELRDGNGNPTTNSADAAFAYDTLLGVTWDLTPNNTALTWEQASSWAAGLIAGRFSGWSLPTADPTCVSTYNCTQSQMGELWYTELGNVVASLGEVGNVGGGLSNTGPFNNLASQHYYWLGTEYAPNPVAAYVFNIQSGQQIAISKDFPSFALALRSGDVAPVPEPGVPALLLSGLGAVMTIVCCRGHCGRFLRPARQRWQSRHSEGVRTSDFRRPPSESVTVRSGSKPADRR